MENNSKLYQLTVLTDALDIFMRLLDCMTKLKTILVRVRYIANKVIMNVLMKLDQMMKGAQGESKIAFLVVATFKLHKAFLLMKLNAKKDVFLSINIKHILRMMINFIPPASWTVSRSKD